MTAVLRGAPTSITRSQTSTAKSGSVSVKVMVPAASSVRMPSERSQSVRVPTEDVFALTRIPRAVVS